MEMSCSTMWHIKPLRMVLSQRFWRDRASSSPRILSSDSISCTGNGSSGRSQTRRRKCWRTCSEKIGDSGRAIRNDFNTAYTTATLQKHFISVTLIKINPLPFPFPSSPKALVLGYGAANVDLRLLMHKIFNMS